MLEYIQSSKNFQERSKILQDWLESPARLPLLKAERQCINQQVKSIFGYHACHVGTASDPNFLDDCRINHHFRLVFNVKDIKLTESAIQCDPCFWPFESNSLDLVLLHHVLELVDSPYHLLNQAADSIMPDGKLLIVAFNPWSLVGGSRWLVPERIKVFKEMQLFQISRLRDWLTLLGFSVESIHYGAYMNSLEWLFQGFCIESCFSRWQLPIGGFYSILSTKKVHGMIPITEPWFRRKNSGHSVAQPIID